MCLSPSGITLRPDLRPLGLPGLHYIAYSNWSLATHLFFYSSKPMLIQATLLNPD